MSLRSGIAFVSLLAFQSGKLREGEITVSKSIAFLALLTLRAGVSLLAFQSGELLSREVSVSEGIAFLALFSLRSGVALVAFVSLVALYLGSVQQLAPCAVALGRVLPFELFPVRRVPHFRGLSDHRRDESVLVAHKAVQHRERVSRQIIPSLYTFPVRRVKVLEVPPVIFCVVGVELLDRVRVLVVLAVRVVDHRHKVGNVQLVVRRLHKQHGVVRAGRVAVVGNDVVGNE